MGAMQQNLYGNYRNRTFTDVWNNVQSFQSDLAECGLPVKIDVETQTTLFYLLYARYGNSTIASSDENQFKYKLFSLIFQYGPTWEKRLEIQDSLRALDLDELMDGGKAVYNTAFNPNQAPSTDALEELQYINQQNTTKYKKSKVEAYNLVLSLLKTDVTEEFIGKFKKLFLVVVSPEEPLWYVTNLEQGGEEDDD